MRTVHYSLWLKKILIETPNENVVVIVGDPCEREVVQWMTEQGDIMVITAGGTGIPAWFPPVRLILDETFNYQNYSHRIWYDAVIFPQIKGKNMQVFSCRP